MFETHSQLTTKQHQDFLRIMKHHLQPHLDMPEDEGVFWEMLVTTIAMAAAMIAAQYLAPMIAASVAGEAAVGTAGTTAVVVGGATVAVSTTALSVTSFALAATVAGLTELEGEGLLVGFGLQKGVDYSKVLMTALSAGLGAGASAGGWFNLPALSALGKGQEIAQAMVNQGMLSVTQQVMNLATKGTRLDFQGLITSALTAPIGASIAAPDLTMVKSELLRNVSTAVYAAIRSGASSVIEGVLTQRFSLSSMMANLVGAEAETFTRQRLGATPTEQGEQARRYRELFDGANATASVGVDVGAVSVEAAPQRRQLANLNAGSATHKAKPAATQSTIFASFAAREFAALGELWQQTKADIEQGIETGSQWLEGKKVKAAEMQRQAARSSAQANRNESWLTRAAHSFMEAQDFGLVGELLGTPQGRDVVIGSGGALYNQAHDLLMTPVEVGLVAVNALSHKVGLPEVGITLPRFVPANRTQAIAAKTTEVASYIPAVFAAARFAGVVADAAVARLSPSIAGAINKFGLITESTRRGAVMNGLPEFQMGFGGPRVPRNISESGNVPIRLGTSEGTTATKVADEIAGLRRISANSKNTTFLDQKISSRGFVNNSGFVKVYRVEGEVNQRIIIGSNGGVKLVAGDSSMLYLNFGNEERAMAFFEKRINQTSFTNPSLVTFDIDAAFLLKLRTSSTPQRLARQFHDFAQIADPTKATDQFGVPGILQEKLEEHILQGSGMRK